MGFTRDKSLGYNAGSGYSVGLVTDPLFSTLKNPCQPPEPQDSYNRQQIAVGACSEGDVAATVLTRILGHYRSSGHMLCDAGSLAMSKVRCMMDKTHLYV